MSDDWDEGGDARTAALTVAACVLAFLAAFALAVVFL